MSTISLPPYGAIGAVAAQHGIVDGVAAASVGGVRTDGGGAEFGAADLHEDDGLAVGAGGLERGDEAGA